MNQIKYELKRFILSGVSAVLIDSIAYGILIYCGINITSSKAASFSIGTIYSYFINKKWTFKAMGGTKIFIKFIFIYFLSLNINFTANRLIINNLGKQNLNSILFAFIISTMLSAIFNFLFLKNYVFRKK